MTSGLPLDAPLLPCLSFSLFDRTGQRVPGSALAKTVGREGLGDPCLQGYSVCVKQVDFVDLGVGEGEGIVGFHLGSFWPNVTFPGLDWSQGGKYLGADTVEEF